MNLSEFTDSQLRELALEFKTCVEKLEYRDHLLAKAYSQLHLDIRREQIKREQEEE